MTNLPFDFNYDDVEILKSLNKANHKLGQLNGAINLLPNPYVLFNAITLGEAKESSEIENIVTTFGTDIHTNIRKACRHLKNITKFLMTGWHSIPMSAFLTCCSIWDLKQPIICFFRSSKLHRTCVLTPLFHVKRGKWGNYDT